MGLGKGGGGGKVEEGLELARIYSICIYLYPTCWIEAYLYIVLSFNWAGI